MRLDRRNIPNTAALALAASCIAFGLWRLRFGLSFSDEGFALSTPARYAFGDIPFRDEVLNSLRWFDIMARPIISRLPADGAIIALRLAAFIFHVISISSLVLAVKPRIGRLATVFLFAAALFSNVFTYWTPTYHSVALDFLAISTALCIAGCRASTANSAIALGLLSAAAAALACLCELPAAAGLIAPAAALLILRRRAAAFTAAYTATIVIFAAAAFLALSASGLIPFLKNALSLQLGIQPYSASFKAAWMLRETALSLPWALAHSLCWALALPRAGRARTAAGLMAVAILYGAIPAYMVAKLEYFEFTRHLLGFIIFSAAFAATRRHAGPGATRFAVPTAVGLAWAFLLAASAGSGFFTSVYLALPFSLSAFAAASAPESRAGQGSPAAAPAPAVALACIAAALIAGNLYSAPSGSWIWNLDGQFGHGKLRGVRYYSQRIAETEALLDYLSPRLTPGETMLTFYEAPMLNYLTNTRQALATGLPSRNWPEASRLAFIRDMVSRGRTPRYAVNLGGVAREPIYSFVRSRYRPAARFGPFIVWKLAPASPTPSH